MQRLTRVTYTGIHGVKYDQDTKTLTIDIPTVCCEELHNRLDKLMYDLDMTKAQIIEFTEKLYDCQISNYLSRKRIT